MKVLDFLLLDDKINTSSMIFEDFCFNNIKAAIFAEKEEQFNAFCDVLKYPSVDVNVLRERQLIFEDFCTYNHLSEDIYKICCGAERYKIFTQVSKYNNITSPQRLDDYIKQTIPMINILISLGALFKHKSFKSTTLKNINFESVLELIDEIKKAERILNSSCFKLSIKFSDGFKLKTAEAVSCEKINLQQDKNDKSKMYYNENTIFYNGYSMTQFVAEELSKVTVLNLCSVVSQINSAIYSIFKEMKKAAEFYIAAQKIKRYLDTKKLSYCIPEIIEDKKFGIEAESLYDLSLAAFDSETAPVTNSFDCSNGNMLIITGLNRGGKTTFLRSVGIAQLFAQAGLFVPAESYKCSCFCGILTHFPAEEDSKMDFGKLAEELTRLRADFPIVADGGLALFNESFATTTTREGAEIAVDVLKALSQTKSTVIFVTHLYELATKIDELNNVLFNDTIAISMVTDTDENNTRTYKITMGEPIENLNAIKLF